MQLNGDVNVDMKCIRQEPIPFTSSKHIASWLLWESMTTWAIAHLKPYGSILCRCRNLLRMKGMEDDNLSSKLNFQKGFQLLNE
jgi:hypothetical protein